MHFSAVEGAVQCSIIINQERVYSSLPHNDFHLPAYMRKVTPSPLNS